MQINIYIKWYHINLLHFVRMYIRMQRLWFACRTIIYVCMCDMVVIYDTISLREKMPVVNQNATSLHIHIKRSLSIISSCYQLVILTCQISISRVCIRFTLFIYCIQSLPKSMMLWLKRNLLSFSFRLMYHTSLSSVSYTAKEYLLPTRCETLSGR